jgi:hypothetical protein
MQNQKWPMPFQMTKSALLLRNALEKASWLASWLADWCKEEQSPAGIKASLANGCTDDNMNDTAQLTLKHKVS